MAKEGKSKGKKASGKDAGAGGRRRGKKTGEPAGPSTSLHASSASQGALEGLKRDDLHKLIADAVCIDGKWGATTVVAAAVTGDNADAASLYELAASKFASASHHALPRGPGVVGHDLVRLCVWMARVLCV